MVRCGDYHCINVRPGQEFAIVIIGDTSFICIVWSLRGVSFFYATLGLLAAHTVHIAHRKYLKVPVASQSS